MVEEQEGAILSGNTKHVPYQGKGQGSYVGEGRCCPAVNLLHKETENIN